MARKPWEPDTAGAGRVWTIQNGTVPYGGASASAASSAPASPAPEPAAIDYDAYSTEQLRSRIAELEASLAAAQQQQAASSSSATRDAEVLPRRKRNGQPYKEPRPFDFSIQPQRKIALRFCYDGSHYGGLAAQHGAVTPLPTVEALLWHALVEARLVDGSLGMEATGWTRCGRTDKGVSAAGQVVALWIRSRKVDERADRAKYEEELRQRREQEELPYIVALNRILPLSIRVLAWSPVSPSFSARFSCRYRHYKYFFPLGSPLPSNAVGPTPRLDLVAMRDAASRLLGDHDFRNLCRVDPTKQLTNFRRRIDGVSIDEVPRTWSSGQVPSSAAVAVADDEEPMLVLNLRGTAFLYHQVRHIMSILMLVGAGLEKPQIVDELLNTSAGGVARDARWAWEHGVSAKNGRIVLPGSTATEDDGIVADGTPTGPVLKRNVPGHEEFNFTPEEQARAEAVLEQLTVFAAKPQYEMAHEAPLVLWDCGFRPNELAWRAGTYDGPLPAPEGADLSSAATLTAAQLHSEWTRRATAAQLWRHFVWANPAPLHGTQKPSKTFAEDRFPALPHYTPEERSKFQIVPLGNGWCKPGSYWRGLVNAKREESAEEKNAAWLIGAGKRRAEKKGITPMQLAKGRNHRE
ncbi:tRNA pseudouridine synthase [Tilletiopsis washingtonensis]|uniref:tRNA pseudouridine synthase n=1 Tax=Tilletiopsis washingtonensis TaxID=58919 RepID=A0A316Z235_9BASI|nr:tRNA pseudouridine synthase [Tilletiopsis washingtonensis]PWN95028.1 tRNA pseudouridine synthase [Tilletiopsis washingtonensis]